MKRTTKASLAWRPYSARYVPANMPSGAATTRPIAVTIKLPTIEFNRPPTTPGGAVILVKTSSERPPTPFPSKAARISTSQLRPKKVAAYDSTVHMTLRRRRPE